MRAVSLVGSVAWSADDRLSFVTITTARAPLSSSLYSGITGSNTKGGSTLNFVSTFIYGVRGTSILLTSIYGIDDLGSFLVSVVGFTKAEFYEYVIYYGFPVRYLNSSFSGGYP